MFKIAFFYINVCLNGLKHFVITKIKRNISTTSSNVGKNSPVNGSNNKINKNHLEKSSHSMIYFEDIQQQQSHFFHSQCSKDVKNSLPFFPFHSLTEDIFLLVHYSLPQH